MQPEFVMALKKTDAYPENIKKIKLIETPASYLFKADGDIYKIKKTGNEFPTLAIKEALCHEECQISKRFNPDWTIEVHSVTKNNDVYQMGGSEGETIEYALKMEALGDRWFLSNQLEKDKASATDMSRIATRIAEVHAESPAKEKQGGTGRSDRFRALCEDMLYQMKRYFDPSITQPILDMIHHPLEKFIADNTRLFSKRLRKGRMVLGHGSFLPEHIFAHGEIVRFISPHEVYKKLAVLDAANDVASMMVELALRGKTELQETFLEQYLTISKDQDLLKMLPAYKTYCALKQGVRTCELKVSQNQEELGSLAMDYFNLAVRFSREIPRE